MTQSDAVSQEIPQVQLKGVHHTARPTWKLAETVRFYRDQLGLPLVHAISAKGWGPDDHADFLHFFFDSGNDSTIAFFYYIGTERPEWLEVSNHYQSRATHTAWKVDSYDELLKWRDRVEKVGIPLRYQIRHEVIESIYFNDPNGYPIEITYQVRPFEQSDINDANRTIDSAIALEEELNEKGKFTAIDQVWTRKGHSLGAPEKPGTAAMFVLNVPEFEAVIEVAKTRDGYSVVPVNDNYVRIEGNPNIEFSRKELGFKPAVWYGILTGGLVGHIESIDMDAIKIVPEVAS